MRAIVAGASAIAGGAARKPPALPADPLIVPFAPASPGENERFAAGIAEARRLGWRVAAPSSLVSDAYFAAPVETRRKEFLAALALPQADALIAVRGGYGSNYLLDGLKIESPERPHVVLGFSDVTSLQLFLWQKHRWVTFYGPMLAAGLDHGAGRPHGYDEASLLSALRGDAAEWSMNLQGEPLVAGVAEGVLLGGCLTLLQMAIGTPWELDAREAILLLEDRAMKPWQVDRALMHLVQAGKLEHVRGIVLGDFPECDPPVSGSPTVRQVAARILGQLGVPVVYGAPLGHTARPMLTVPLGVRARLVAEGQGKIEILERAVAQWKEGDPPNLQG